MPEKRFLFVVTEDWYFYSHRRPQVRAAQDCGFKVGVITNVDKHKEAIEALGVDVIPLSFSRRSLNPFKALAQIAALRKIYKQEKPDIVHHIAMKPILFGSIAAFFSGVPHIVNAFAGLGYVFNAKTMKATLIRLGLWLPFRILMRRKNTHLLFQNSDDLETLSAQGYVAEGRASVIRGSGIDLAAYPLKPMPDAKKGLVCAFAGRMIGIKGLPTLKEAFEILEDKNVPVRLELYGKPDPENPGSWTEEELRVWAQSDNVAYKGHADNMAALWANVHIAIQASYGGEGVPKSLLEAAACARAIVATDVPGCREVVDDGVNGALVPPYNAQELAAALEGLAKDPEKLTQMGQASRKIVENDMSAGKVQEKTAVLYRRLMETKQ